MFSFDYYQFVLTLTIIFLTFLLSFVFGLREKKDIPLIFALVIWHTFFCLAYYIFSFYNTADAAGYYQAALLGNYEFYPGSRFVVLTTGLLYNLFDSNYLNSFLFFNIFGVLGLVLIFKIFKNYIGVLGAKWYLLLFTPSMSFWSSALGKDSIVFFGVSLFLYTVVTNKKNFFLLPISLFFIFMVRPHIAFVVVLSYFIYILFVSKLHMFLKFFFISFLCIGIFFSLGFIKDYIGLDEASLAGVGDYVDYRQGLNQVGGSSFDLASMSYPMQMFTYTFRPLPFEAHSLLALFTSFENSFFILLFLYISFKTKFDFKGYFENRNFWLFIYFIVSWSILAVTTANLGIATRQKWMFMPIFIYLMIYVLYRYKVRKNT